MTPFEALMACRDKAGSDSQLARDLGTNQPKIWRMINSAKRMHEDLVLLAAEKYEIPPYVLRPDLYPRDLPQRFYGVPYAAEEPTLDEFGPAVPSNRRSTFDGRDQDISAPVRFHGVAGR